MTEVYMRVESSLGGGGGICYTVNTLAYLNQSNNST